MKGRASPQDARKEEEGMTKSEAVIHFLALGYVDL